MDVTQQAQPPQREQGRSTGREGQPGENHAVERTVLFRGQKGRVGHVEPQPAVPLRSEACGDPRRGTVRNEQPDGQRRESRPENQPPGGRSGIEQMEEMTDQPVPEPPAADSDEHARPVRGIHAPLECHVTVIHGLRPAPRPRATVSSAAPPDEAPGRAA